MRIHKNDTVVIIAGKDKGKTGKVLRALPSTAQVIVEGVNMQKHHKKAGKNEKQGGGIVEVAAPVHVSNVQYVDPKTNKGTRLSIGKGEKGKNVRIAKASGTKLS